MKKVIQAKQVYSSKEAADFLKIAPRTVSDLCRQGKIVASKAKEYRILGESLLNYLGFSSGTAVSKAK